MALIIEGTIGAGKTTMMNGLEQQWPELYTCAYEPIKEWTKDTTLLSDLYRDPRQHAFAFEVGSILRLSEPTRHKGEKLAIQERSIFAAYYVFSNYQFELGNISNSEFETLTRLFNRCVPASNVGAIFYLKLDYETAYDRIVQRGREAEMNITKSYVRRICDLYDQLLIDNASSFSIPIHVVDAKETPSSLCEQFHDFVNNLEIKTIQKRPPNLFQRVSKIVDWTDGWAT